MPGGGGGLLLRPPAVAVAFVFSGDDEVAVAGRDAHWAIGAAQAKRYEKRATATAGGMRLLLALAAGRNGKGGIFGVCGSGTKVRVMRQEPDPAGKRRLSPAEKMKCCSSTAALQQGQCWQDGSFTYRLSTLKPSAARDLH